MKLLNRLVCVCVFFFVVLALQVHIIHAVGEGTDTAVSEELDEVVPALPPKTMRPAAAPAVPPKVNVPRLLLLRVV